MKRSFTLLCLFLAFSLLVSGQTAKELNKQGIDFFKKMEYKQAFESFTKAIALDPTFGEAYYNRANTWYQLPSDTYPDYDGCLDLKKAIELGFKAAVKKKQELGCE